MDDEVGPELEQVGDVVEGRLRDDAGDALELGDHGAALRPVHVGQALVARDSLVRENADGDLAERGGGLDDVEVARMHQVGTHGDIDFFHGGKGVMRG